MEEKEKRLAAILAREEFNFAGLSFLEAAKKAETALGVLKYSLPPFDCKQGSPEEAHWREESYINKEAAGKIEEDLRALWKRDYRAYYGKVERALSELTPTAIAPPPPSASLCIVLYNYRHFSPLLVALDRIAFMGGRNIVKQALESLAAKTPLQLFSAIRELGYNEEIIKALQKRQPLAKAFSQIREETIKGIFSIMEATLWSDILEEESSLPESLNISLQEERSDLFQFYREDL